MFNLNRMAKWIAAPVLLASSLAAGNLKPNGSDGPTLSPSFPIADRCGDCSRVWHVDIGVLYEQLGFSNMSPGRGYFPVVQNPTAGVGDSIPYNSYVDQTSVDLLLNYDYSVGVTASLGHLLRHDNWFVCATFDWLSAGLNTTFEDENYLYVYPGDFALQTTVYSEVEFNGNYWWGKLACKGNADFYDLGIFLSRGSYHSAAFSYTPKAGVEALWFNNSYKTKFIGSNNTAQEGVFSLEKEQHNWGVGAAFGFDGEYCLAKGVSIFSESKVGVLLGEMNYTYTTFVPQGGDVTDDRFAVNKGNMANVMYVPARTILGIKLSTYCINDTQYIAVRLGFDAQAVLSPVSRARLERGYEISVDQKNAFSFVQLMNLDNSVTRNGLFVDFEWNF